MDDAILHGDGPFFGVSNACPTCTPHMRSPTCVPHMHTTHALPGMHASCSKRSLKLRSYEDMECPCARPAHVSPCMCSFWIVRARLRAHVAASSSMHMQLLDRAQPALRAHCCAVLCACAASGSCGAFWPRGCAPQQGILCTTCCPWWTP